MFSLCALSKTHIIISSHVVLWSPSHHLFILLYHVSTVSVCTSWIHMCGSAPIPGNATPRSCGLSGRMADDALSTDFELNQVKGSKTCIDVSHIDREVLSRCWQLCLHGCLLWLRRQAVAKPGQTKGTYSTSFEKIRFSGCTTRRKLQTCCSFLETLNCLLRCYVDALACLRRSSCCCFTTWKRRWGDEACPAHRAGIWCGSLFTAQACPTDALMPSPRGPRRVLLPSWRAQWLSAWTYIIVLNSRNKRQVPCWWHRCSARRAPRHAQLIRRARHQHEQHDRAGSEWKQETRLILRWQHQHRHELRLDLW